MRSDAAIRYGTARRGSGSNGRIRHPIIGSIDEAERKHMLLPGDLAAARFREELEPCLALEAIER
jgi:hypothetical protein